MDMGERIIRLVAEIDGHVYLYHYPPDEYLRIAEVISDQVDEGKIPALAGAVLMQMAMAGGDDADF